MNSRLKSPGGVYLITADMTDTNALCELTATLLKQPIALLQYRNKAADKQLQSFQAKALLTICRAAGVPLIINDDWRLAMEIGANGVHLGGTDAQPDFVRSQVGDDMLIGVSCYSDLVLAGHMSKQDVDYLAFGAVFASPTKPHAGTAALAVFGQAKALNKPLVAIGGITSDNSRQVLDAGADFIAVISGVYSAANPELALSAYLQTFSKASA